MIPILVLPNIDVADTIESASVAVMSSSSHAFRKSLAGRPNLRHFLSQFRSAAGRKITPSIVVLLRDEEGLRRIDALASFRDAVAASIIPVNRAMLIQNEQPLPFVWGDYFKFYPWMVDRNDEYLIGISPALTGVEEVAPFKPQALADVFPQRLESHGWDHAMLAMLLHRWEAFYVQDEDTWENRALFRSLNTAFAASQMPAGRDVTVFDVGRAIGLWVSAFEILSHPGASGIANRNTVWDLLDRAPWKCAGSKDKQCTVTAAKGPVQHVSNAAWIYNILYRTRNDFLHGNPVTKGSLQFGESERLIYDFAAPLYRMALTAFSPVEDPKITGLEGEALKSALGRQMRLVMPQIEIERALLLARRPVVDSKG